MVKKNQKRERRFTDEFYSNVEEEDAKEGRIRGKARFVSGKFTLMMKRKLVDDDDDDA